MRRVKLTLQALTLALLSLTFVAWLGIALSDGWIHAWLGRENAQAFDPRYQWREVLRIGDPNALRYVEYTKTRVLPTPKLILMVNPEVCQHPGQFASIVRAAHITGASVLFIGDAPCHPSEITLPRK